MLQQKHPDDFVIATGQTNKLSDFADVAFRTVGLDWQKYVEIDPAFIRPVDSALVKGNPTKAHQKLRWKAMYKMDEVVRMMVDAELSIQKKGVV